MSTTYYGNRLSYGDQLTRAAREWPDSPAVTGAGRRIRFGELDRRGSAMGNELVRLGVERGDRVGILLSNRVEFVETFYAAARIGAIAVPLNFRLVASELEHLLNDCTPELVVTEAAYHPALRAACDGVAEV